MLAPIATEQERNSSFASPLELSACLKQNQRVTAGRAPNVRCLADQWISRKFTTNGFIHFRGLFRRGFLEDTHTDSASTSADSK